MQLDLARPSAELPYAWLSMHTFARTATGRLEFAETAESGAKALKGVTRMASMIARYDSDLQFEQA